MSVPDRMKNLPVVDGLPVPKWVAFENNKYNFKKRDAAATDAALRKTLCSVCGAPLGRNVAFIGNAHNLVSHLFSEPPAHRDCATFIVDHYSKVFDVDHMLCAVTRKYGWSADDRMFFVPTAENLHWSIDGVPTTDKEKILALVNEAQQLNSSTAHIQSPAFDLKKVLP